jgi:predicted small secreted protein
MEIDMRKLVGLALVAGALMVSACNTVEGVGKDVSSAGNTVAKTADKSK